MIDAGSTGADDVDDFYQLTRKAATEVYALLNISRVGLIAQNELANMANIDAAAVKQAVQRHPDFIVGLKARMSSSVVGENGITPLARAKAMVPLLVPLFVSAFRRADDLALAMEARCYRGGKGRTRMNQLHMSKVDLYGALAVALLTAALVTLNLLGAV